MNEIARNLPAHDLTEALLDRIEQAIRDNPASETDLSALKKALVDCRTNFGHLAW